MKERLKVNGTLADVSLEIEKVGKVAQEAALEIEKLNVELIPFESDEEIELYSDLPLTRNRKGD